MSKTDVSSVGNMRLYDKYGIKCYGVVGTQTDIKDEDGNTLHIGDIVLVTYKNKKIRQNLSIVLHEINDGIDYIRYAYNWAIKGALPGVSVKKVLGFETIEDGFVFDKVEYIK